LALKLKALAMSAAPKSEGTVALPERERQDPKGQLLAAQQFARELGTRRTVRDYDSAHVPRSVIEACIMAAGSAPSGANQQPWHFVAIASSDTKRKIRVAAEAEEQSFYGGRAPDEWLKALLPLGTDSNKAFLETAPWLIAVFYERTGREENGTKPKRYYPHESTGIACGMLLTALHQAGLATLTHTPSPMNFLSELLGREKHEVPYLMIVTGYPAQGCRVPNIVRKPLEAIATFVE
jgi:iodotyrosine deiodinase